VNGTELLKEVERRLLKAAGKGAKPLSDAVLARELGVTQAALSNYKGKELTSKQVVNLMEKVAKRAERQLAKNALVPIIEFFPLEPVELSKTWQLFPTKDGDEPAHPYLVGLRKRLEQSHGIYLFHDSRGSAIYAGKAHKLTLWKEMNDKFNRGPTVVQNIKRVRHPTNNRAHYKGPEEKTLQIVKESIVLHKIASYMSAYEVQDSLIGKFEALIVRSFANDLLNIRMEHF